MGMAASQARFLGLTARKTNVDYEGQQINQQRTALSNQSASYYTNLLSMSVPQPPSVQDFTKTTYTFTDGALNNQLTSMIARTDGSYTVSYLRQYLDNHAVVASTPSRIVRVPDTSTPPNYTYQVGAVTLYSLNDQSQSRVDNDLYLSTLSQDQLNALYQEEQAYIQKLHDKYGLPTDNWLVKYTLNTSTGAWVPTFYNNRTLDNATYDENNTSVSFIDVYTVGAAQVSEEIKGQTAFLEQDATGRYINITFVDSAGVPVATYALTTNTVTDDDAYQDAMNQYEFDKARYDKSIQEINAKIEIIQIEDKDLEIRLKQLDTERTAIDNEMDAVKQVIKKNVESTFKTFG